MRTVSDLNHCSFIAFGPRLCLSIFVLSHALPNVWFSLELVLLLAMSVSHEMQCQTSGLQRNKAFCTGVDWLLVNSRSYAHTHARTDKCNLSIVDIVITSCNSIVGFQGHILHTSYYSIAIDEDWFIQQHIICFSVFQCFALKSVQL